MNKEIKKCLLGICVFVGMGLMFLSGLVLKQKQIKCNMKHGFYNCSVLNLYEGPTDE